MRRTIGFIVGALLLSAPALAQTPVIINPPAATVTFNSPDHTATVPQGQANAGQPLIASYQAMVFLASADVVTATPVVVGPVIAKTLASVVSPATTPPSYVLTFPQLGIGTVGSGANQIPPCTAVAPATCPVYDVVMVSIGPGGTSARAVAAESNPFTLAALQATQTPAGPVNLVVK